MPMMSEEEHKRCLDDFLETVEVLDKENDSSSMMLLVNHIRNMVSAVYSVGYRQLALQYRERFEKYLPFLGVEEDELDTDIIYMDHRIPLRR